ncbi:RusA family crossover junction endodeoxyribonuclease [Arthrobacter woluwensis]|uniref:RusA family crossover junction endodeoxyribonuclease n=1 Tax=Arthrobacter woluwensis TaxID=156980 RepID=UPI00119DB9D5|nr:RusA family crossover junction endodeoxyribonuclease [Arthrobacter woluwensis]
MKPVSFWVAGTPIPQGSKIIWQGRVMDYNKTVLDHWRGLIRAESLRNHKEDPLDMPLRLEIFFYLPRPKRVRWNKPAVKPDADKLLRAVCDALTHSKRAPGIVREDSRFTTITIHKAYSLKPGAHITIQEDA